MKYRVGIFVLCSFLCLCSACGNTNKTEENEKNTFIEREYIEENDIDYIMTTETSEEMMENNSFQQESDISSEAENELDIYVGSYNAYDTDEPMLQIQKNEDGTYLIQIGIFRLTQLDKCTGIEVGDRIEFSTIEWGADKKITGTIMVDDEIATVILVAEWSDTWFKDVDEYKYYKISNIPNIYGVEQRISLCEILRLKM